LERWLDRAHFGGRDRATLKSALGEQCRDRRGGEILPGVQITVRQVRHASVKRLGLVVQVRR